MSQGVFGGGSVVLEGEENPDSKSDGGSVHGVDRVSSGASRVLLGSLQALTVPNVVCRVEGRWIFFK